YVEFSESGRVPTQPIQDEQSPLGGTVVWLKAGTNAQHTKVVTRQLQANFLSGGITSRYLGGTTPYFSTGSARAGAAATVGYNCSVNPHIPACRPLTDG